MKILGLSGLDPRIQSVIEDFRALAPDDGFDACKKTSAQFTQFAIERGVDAKWMNLGGGPESLNPSGKWVNLPRESWIHYVTLLNDEIYVDWTASQFGEMDSRPSISVGSSEWAREYDVTDALDEYLDEMDMLEEAFLRGLGQRNISIDIGYSRFVSSEEDAYRDVGVLFKQIKGEELVVDEVYAYEYGRDDRQGWTGEFVVSVDDYILDGWWENPGKSTEIQFSWTATLIEDKKGIVSPCLEADRTVILPGPMYTIG